MNVSKPTQKIFKEKFASSKKGPIFAPAKPKNRLANTAEIAQLVEHNLAKVGVASSSLVFRSRFREHKVARSVILSAAKVARMVEW